jgi:hypothetical protein
MPENILEKKKFLLRFLCKPSLRRKLKKIIVKPLLFALRQIKFTITSDIVSFMTPLNLRPFSKFL